MGVVVGGRGEGVHEAHCYVLQVMPSDPVCLFGLLKDEEFTASSAATLGLPTVDGAYLGVGGGGGRGCVAVSGCTFGTVCPFYSCRHALPVC